MSANHSKFQQLLYDGITAIQRESRQEKKTRRTIHEELAKSINRKVSTIEFYLQGHIPTSYNEIEQLAKVIYTRGKLDEKWLEHFLTAADYRRVDDFIVKVTAAPPEVRSEPTQYQCKRLRHEFNTTVFADRRSVTNMKIEMQSTSTFEISNIRHRSIRSSYASPSPRKIDFIPIARSGIGTIRYHVFHNTPEFLQWHVIFDPPLQPKETATYEYTLEMRDVSPWTIEECREFLQQGFIFHLCCTVDVTVTFPTESLYMSVVLPPNYDITLPASGGFRATVQLNEDLIEKTRLIKEQCFRAQYDQQSNQWTLSLTVKNPKVGYAYYLEWIPPSENLLNNTG